MNERAANPVFRNHTVICGWNCRGASIVRTLKALSPRPILVVHGHLPEVIADVGAMPGVFTIPGDCAQRSVLLDADVPSARSVVVLADDALAGSADARSVQVALQVERIQSAVYTVVEIRDIRNKQHFAWTKVDDLITSEEITVRLFAQGMRHVLEDQGAQSSPRREGTLLDLYRRLVSPHRSGSHLFRVDLGWEQVKHKTFDQMIAACLAQGVMPLALVGYRRHEVKQEYHGNSPWVSWKTHTLANPPSGTPLRALWPEWPETPMPLGLLVLAPNMEVLEQVRGEVEKSAVVPAPSLRSS